MSTDFHLEHLHERASEGSLSDSDRDRLDAHIAGCTACQLVRAMEKRAEARDEDWERLAKLTSSTMDRL